LFDVIVIGPSDVRLVQVKAGMKYLSAVEREQIVGLPVPANVSRECWQFPDRCWTPLIERLRPRSLLSRCGSRHGSATNCQEGSMGEHPSRKSTWNDILDRSASETTLDDSGNGQAGWPRCSLNLGDQRLRRDGSKKRRETVYRRAIQRHDTKRGRSAKNGNAAKLDALTRFCSRGVALEEAPGVGAPAALIHRIRKRIGLVRQRFRVRRRAIRAIFNEATERGGLRLEDRIEEATTGNRENRVLRHGLTPLMA
jgi:hypothetical protein